MSIVQSITRAGCVALALVVFAAPASGDIVNVVPQTPIGYGPVPLEHDIDLTGNGIIDYKIISDGGGTDIVPQGNNSLIVIPERPPDLGSFVAPLTAGFTIPSTLPAGLAWYDGKTDPIGSSTIGADSTAGHLGYFSEKTAYVGLKFDYGGATHYGWMEISNPVVETAGYVLGWAYDTQPDTAIIVGAVPEPSTYAFLGAGLAGLVFHRLRKSPHKRAFPQRGGTENQAADS